MRNYEGDDLIVRSLDSTGLPPWDDGREPVCPVCGEACDTIYFDMNGNAVGCNECLLARDAWDLMYEEAYE